MPQVRTETTTTPSRLLIVIASAAILVHLGAVVVKALAAPSGPWPQFEGPLMAGPPPFAQSLNDQMQLRLGDVALPYLQIVRLAHDYHFRTNRPIIPGVYLEARLKDAQGNVTATINFPDPGANAWVRGRQALLVQEFVPDQPVMPPEGETIPAPQQQVRTVPIWVGEGSLRLQRVAEHLVPRNRPVFSPSEWSVMLARSCARYLCREYGAASVEIVRHSRDVVPLADIVRRESPPAAPEEIVASYGETSRE